MEPQFVVIEPNVPKPTHEAAIKVRELLKTGTEYCELVSEPADGSVLLDCFMNVDRVTQQKGGSAVYGWRIWETFPGVMMEAEFHSVWQDEDDQLHEVTPQMLDSIDHILFLPDPTRTYQGKQVDNLRIALVKDKLVEQFIKNAKRRFKALNKGHLAYEHGAIPVTPEIAEIDRKFKRLENQIKQKYFLR